MPGDVPWVVSTFKHLCDSITVNFGNRIPIDNDGDPSDLRWRVSPNKSVSRGQLNVVARHRSANQNDMDRYRHVQRIAQAWRMELVMGASGHRNYENEDEDLPKIHFFSVHGHQLPRVLGLRSCVEQQT